MHNTVPVGPDDRQGVVRHGAAPCPTDPAKVRRRLDLQQGIVVARGVCGKGDAVGDAVVGGVGLEHDSRLRVRIRCGICLGGNFSRAKGVSLRSSFMIRHVHHLGAVPLTRAHQADEA
jgi:hypothetical protein